MRRENLFERIQERGDLPSEDAARDAAQATMRTLGERIAGGEAEAVADRLPDDLAGPLASDGGEAAAFSVSEFVDRVESREDVDGGDPERHASAVIGTLADRLNRREWNDVTAQLPPEYADLYGTERGVGET